MEDLKETETGVFGNSGYSDGQCFDNSDQISKNVEYETLDIMFYDLNKDAQERVLDFYNLETEEDGDFENNALFILEKG